MWLGPPLRWSGFGSGLENSSPLRDRIKYAFKVRYDVKHVHYDEKSVMTS